jgi:type VII secretion effector (TIGR04197 family)
MLNKAANKATTVGEGIALNLTRLINEVETSATQFKGGAGSTFQNVTQELSGELRQILTALNQMAENIKGSNAAFGATDADASSEISKVASTYLPGASNVANALRG